MLTTDGAFVPIAFIMSVSELAASICPGSVELVTAAENLTRPGPAMITSELEDSTVRGSTVLEGPARPENDIR